ncbi:hypothetical protein ABIA38_002844 [Embleya sp. AB8]
MSCVQELVGIAIAPVERSSVSRTAMTASTAARLESRRTPRRHRIGARSAAGRARDGRLAPLRTRLRPGCLHARRPVPVPVPVPAPGGPSPPDHRSDPGPGTAFVARAPTGTPRGPGRTGPGRPPTGTRRGLPTTEPTPRYGTPGSPPTAPRPQEPRTRRRPRPRGPTGRTSGPCGAIVRHRRRGWPGRAGPNSTGAHSGSTSPTPEPAAPPNARRPRAPDGSCRRTSGGIRTARRARGGFMRR